MSSIKFYLKLAVIGTLLSLAVGFTDDMMPPEVKELVEELHKIICDKDKDLTDEQCKAYNKCIIDHIPAGPTVDDALKCIADKIGVAEMNNESRHKFCADPKILESCFDESIIGHLSGEEGCLVKACNIMKGYFECELTAVGINKKVPYDCDQLK